MYRSPPLQAEEAQRSVRTVLPPTHYVGLPSLRAVLEELRSSQDEGTADFGASRAAFLVAPCRTDPPNSAEIAYRLQEPY